MGIRSAALGYGADSTRQKFTSKERDSETGLDFFGARYFAPVQGRFTSPDEPLYDQYADEPQSWNLYSYVRNNPLVYVDPNGKETCYYSTDKDGNKTLVGCDNQKGFSIKDNVLTYKGESHKLEDLDAQEVVRECGCAVGHEQQIPYARPYPQFDWNDRTGAKGIAALAGAMVVNPLPNPHKFVIGGGLLLGAGLAYLTNYNNLPAPIAGPNVYTKAHDGDLVKKIAKDYGVDKHDLGRLVEEVKDGLRDHKGRRPDKLSKEEIEELAESLGGKKN